MPPRTGRDMESTAKACIVNAAHGKWYPEGQRRLERSLVHHGFQFDFKKYTGFANDSYDKGNGYHVKPSAIEVVIAEGYTHILWLDCSVWAVQSPNKIFDLINEQGYYFWKNGFNCAQECSDKCLDYFKVSRDEAEKMPCVSTSMFGVNLLNPKGMEFMDRWLKSAKDGVFNGSREHDGQSKDPRFLHHRQDQSAASIIVNQMGLYIHEMNDLSAYHENYVETPRSVIFLMRGL